ncbi:threonine/homoserine efflux transporter RhtA [Herbihabitans rhizosphaerae]|uniref:Threonine/homoserine efflux transporter RhtA n=1 Tax=Herbihabitans rhizosphaerae TaxID=1872711 RepID=A0A4V2ES12_9PSEU|nr:EamA family transporter [Herbihabitans rhizosphaerae]RZS34757.1 threonine/homoserine efflux transporter RhtA [Herbihabitans rhizosphaerae]
MQNVEAIGSHGTPAPVTPDARTPVSNRARGTLLIVLASVAFGSSGPLAKPAMTAGLSPEHVAAARIGIAAVLMLVVLAVVRPALLRVRKAQMPLLLGYGLLGVAGVQLCYFAAVARIPVGVAMLLEFTSPVLVALWVRFVRRTVLPAMMWMGTVLALAGLAMVAQFWQGFTLDALGLLFGIGAALCSAAYFLLGEHGARAHDPLGLVTWGLVVGAVAVCVIAPPWTMPAEILTLEADLGPWHPPVWTLLVAVAVLSTAIAYLLGTNALRHLPSNVASVLALLEPIVAITLAWALLGQSLTVAQIVGALVLLAGATLVQRAASAQPTPADPQP